MGISTKTVYKYFTNKEELLEEALNLFHEKAYEYLDKIPLDETSVAQVVDLWINAIESLSKANKVFFDDLDHYYPSLGKKMDRVIGKKFRTQMLLLLQKGMEQEYFRDDIDTEITLASFFVLFHGVVRSEQYHRFKSSKDIIYNSILHLIRGICTVKGSKLLDKHLQFTQFSNNK